MNYLFAGYELGNLDDDVHGFLHVLDRHELIAAVEVQATGKDIGTRQALERELKTLPAFRWVMNVDDKYTILVDREELKTRRFESDIREGNYRFWSNYVYDWPEMTVHTRWQGRRMVRDTTKTMSLTPRSMDPVSLYFHLRSIDPATLQEGKTEVLEMLLEDTIRHLRYRFLGRETKKIRSMGTFRTLKFACQIGTSEGYSFTDGTEFTVWISDDKNLIPLYIESPVRIGSVQAYISGYHGLKYPLSSKIK